MAFLIIDIISARPILQCRFSYDCKMKVYWQAWVLRSANQGLIQSSITLRECWILDRSTWLRWKHLAPHSLILSVKTALKALFYSLFQNLCSFFHARLGFIKAFSNVSFKLSFKLSFRPFFNVSSKLSLMFFFQLSYNRLSIKLKLCAFIILS